MAIRFAAASGLALAAALVFAAPAGAQSFFSFYEMSPRQIVGMLADDGYELRAPMLRRGDVYVADVTSVSGRSVRLIVSARDGHVVERFASAPRVRQDDDEDVSRFARTRRYDEDPQPSDRGSRGQMALGDIFNPPSRVYGNDSMFGSKPTPPSDVPDDATPKPKHHVAKKHKEPSVAKTSPGSDAPKSGPVDDVQAVEVRLTRPSRLTRLNRRSRPWPQSLPTLLLSPRSLPSSR